MDITPETLQSFLEDAWDACPAAANNLREQLRVYEKAATQLYRGGTIGSVSKNSSSQSYRGPGLGSYTPVQIANAWRLLVNLYDDTVAWVAWQIANPPTNPPAWWPDNADDTDIFFFKRMLCALRGVPEYQVDLTDLRLHPVLGNGTEVLSW